MCYFLFLLLVISVTFRYVVSSRKWVTKRILFVCSGISLDLDYLLSFPLEKFWNSDIPTVLERWCSFVISQSSRSGSLLSFFGCPGLNLTLHPYYFSLCSLAGFLVLHCTLIVVRFESAVPIHHSRWNFSYNPFQGWLLAFDGLYIIHGIFCWYVCVR